MEESIALAAQLIVKGNTSDALFELETNISPQLVSLEAQGIECGHFHAKTTTLIGYAYFVEKNFDCANRFFTSPIPDLAENIPTLVIVEAVALAAMGACDCDTDALVTLFTDYKVSILGKFLDSEEFSPFKQLGIHVKNAYYGKALECAVSVSPEMEIPMRDKLFQKMIPCFNTVSVDVLAKEFGLDTDTVISTTMDLIRRKNLQEYRVNFETLEITRISHEEELEGIRRETHQAMQDTFETLKLAKLKHMTSRYNSHDSSSPRLLYCKQWSV